MNFEPNPRQEIDFEPNPRQSLYLWKLLAFDEGIQFGLIAPLSKASERKELEKNGLIEVPREKKKMPTARNPVKYVLLSEAGWAWAGRNMEAEFSKSQESSLILHKLLSKLNNFMGHNKEIALAELFCSPPMTKSPPAEPKKGDPSGMDIETIIREAYQKQSSGKWNVRVRLAALRKTMPSIPGEELDAALLNMEKAEKLVLYKLDDPREIRPEDDMAAVEVLGLKRHIVYIEE